jgi:sigma-E factor negative regulatory protein RseA
MSMPSSSSAEHDPRSPSPQSRLWLSALADGERDALPHAQAQWRDDAGARERWHLYHLIGDVMRSEELARLPGRDAAFLASLRTRLASEPVPLAPTAAAAATTAPLHARRLGWRAPAAVAAGFLVVAGTLVLLRPEGFGLGGERLARSGAQAPATGVQLVGVPAQGGNGRLVMEGQMIRDPSLDAYFEAHRAVGRGAAAAGPGGGGIRRIELVTPMVPVLPGAAVPAAPASNTASVPR